MALVCTHTPISSMAAGKQRCRWEGAYPEALMHEFGGLLLAHVRIVSLSEKRPGQLLPKSCALAQQHSRDRGKETFPQQLLRSTTVNPMSGKSPVAMCASEKWTPSMLIVPRKGLSSWSPATTTEFHRGSILQHETSGSDELQSSLSVLEHKVENP